MKYIREHRKYFVSLFQIILFIPFFRQGLIGSDWDSYGSYASSLIIENQNIYLPSRPPGLPYLLSSFFWLELISLLISYLVRNILMTSYTLLCSRLQFCLFHHLALWTMLSASFLVYVVYIQLRMKLNQNIYFYS